LVNLFELYDYARTCQRQNCTACRSQFARLSPANLITDNFALSSSKTIFQNRKEIIYISLIRDNSVTTQNKLFSGETFKAFEVLYFSIGATTTQLLSSGELCKLRCDTIPVKSASANVSFYTSNSKM
jgi:hypothetical protein